MFDNITKLHCIIQYLKNENIVYKYLEELDNLAYVFYLANLKHTIEYGSDLYRQGLKNSINFNYIENFKNIYKSYEKREDYLDHLSESDEICLDWAIHMVDDYTGNYD